MADWQVAIPSFNRAEGLNRMTLRTLSDGGVPRDRVTVFCATPEEAAQYRFTLDGGLYGGIEVAALGLMAARNHINRYYPNGAHLVQMDDDVKGLRRLVDGKLAKVPDVGAMVDECFTEMGLAFAELWGIYPTPNAGWMKHRVRTNLCLIVGPCFGHINRHAPHCETTVEDKDDYERSIRYYVAHGSVARVEWYAPLTDYYADTGGQASTRTLATVEEVAATLCARYPGMVAPARSKRYGFAEVRLTQP